MSPAIQALLIVQVFRSICVLAGCLLAYFGYRLFKEGVYEKQGELKAQWGGKSLLLRQVGPGVFFALFGVAMASVGFLRKFEADINIPNQPGTVVYTPAPKIAYDQAPSSVQYDVVRPMVTTTTVSKDESQPVPPKSMKSESPKATSPPPK
ncbi:MAG TPA: hypothetical protein VGG56_13170 [Terracidiphilus sp.]|jgi:hypothetical protein